MRNMPTRFAVSFCHEIQADPGLQVIQKVGLCIALYDLLSASEGLIGHGTGIVNVNGKIIRTKKWDILF